MKCCPRPGGGLSGSRSLSGLDLLARYARLQIQQLQLQIAQRLAALAISGDTVQAKALFQNLDLDLCQGQRLILARQPLISVRDLLVLVGQLRLKLRDDLAQRRIRLRDRLCRETQDVLWITDIAVD